MPQIDKSGKFLYGISVVNPDQTIFIPPQAIQEYGITTDEKIILISGSKTSGGFLVSRKDLILKSKIDHLFKEMLLILNCESSERSFIYYKDRYYCNITINSRGKIIFNNEILDIFKICTGTELLVVRGSSIAFAMVAKGPLLEKARSFKENSGILVQF